MLPMFNNSFLLTYVMPGEPPRRNDPEEKDRVFLSFRETFSTMREVRARMPKLPKAARDFTLHYVDRFNNRHLLWDDKGNGLAPWIELMGDVCEAA